MKKIYIFVWNFKIGGVQKMSILTANGLAEKGHNVTLVCNDQVGDLSRVITEKVKLIKLTIQNTNNPIKLISQFRRLLKALPKGAVIFAGGPNNFRQLVRVNGAFKRWDIIFILHNDLPLKGKVKSQIGYLEIKTLCRSKRLHIVALSKKQRELHRESYRPYSLSVIPNFIDFNHEYLRKKNTGGKVTAVSIGRYGNEKGYDILLEAMKSIDNVEVDVYGVGDDERLRLSNLGIEEQVSNINFKPAVTSVIETISHYDFFILPSRNETFGLVLIEALSAGLPVLTSNCDGPKDIIIDNENGIFVEKNDPRALAEGIKIMVQRITLGEFNPSEMRESASRFDITKVLDRYLELLV